MMREVVVDPNAADLATQFHTALDAAKATERLGPVLGGDAHMGRRGQCRQRVLHVMRAGLIPAHAADRLPAAQHPKL